MLGTAGGLQLDLHGEFTSEHITGDMARVYRGRGFDKPMLEEVARLAPRDTGLFAYLHAPTGEMLRMVRDSMEPAMRQLIEDAFRGTGRYANLDALIKELDDDFKDRWCLIVRPNDYPPDPEGPIHGTEPVPAIALVLWTKNQQAVEALEKLIGGQGQRFGLQGKDKNSGGFFSNTEAGYSTYEYWSQMVPGTGVIVAAKAGEMTVITNSLGMMGHLLKTYSVGGEKYPRLSEEPHFSALVQSSIPKGNLARLGPPAVGDPGAAPVGRAARAAAGALRLHRVPTGRGAEGAARRVRRQEVDRARPGRQAAPRPARHRAPRRDALEDLRAAGARS